MMELLPVMLCATFVGGIVQGISGFGFAIIFLAVMQYFMPYTELLALSTVLAIVMLCYNVITYRKDIVWRWLPLPWVINLIFTVAAIGLLKYTMDFPYWHKLLGLVFIVLSAYLYLGQGRLQVKPGLTSALLFGGAGGILGGLFGVGGPPLVLYFLAIADSKEHYLGSIQMFFLGNMLYDFAGRVLNGMVTVDTFRYGAACALAVLTGLQIGNAIFHRIDAEMLKKIVYALMFVDGWYMLLT